MITREALKAKGYTDEQIDTLLDMFHAEEQELRGQVTKLTSEREEAKAEIAKYQKGGELYFDPAELERLKTFEKETLTRETNAKKTEALTKLFKGAKATDSVAKLLISGHDLEKLELDDKGEIKNGAELLKRPRPTMPTYSAEAGTRECRRPIPTRAATRERKRRKSYIKNKS